METIMSVASGTVSRAAEAASHDRTNREWTDAETGYLLQRAAEGMSDADIATRLDRTPKAIASRIDDVLAGRVYCPIEYTGWVETIRKVHRAASTARRDPKAPLRAAITTERLAAIERHLAELRELLVYDLAIHLAPHGREAIAEMMHMLPPPAAARVHDLLQRLDSYRGQMAGLAVVVRPNPDGGEQPFPLTGTNPPVMTGPGGDFNKPWPAASEWTVEHKPHQIDTTA
jgi:hypothetical protein